MTTTFERKKMRQPFEPIEYKAKLKKSKRNQFSQPIDPSSMAKLPVIDKFRIKTNKPDLPLTVNDFKTVATEFIPEGEYKNVYEMLGKLKRDKILSVR